MIFETLLLGLVVSVIYVEIMDVYPGGIIVPAYVALYLDQPCRVLATVVVALITIGTFRILNGYFILFGKRRFVMFIILGAFWAQFLYWVLPHLFQAPWGLQAIGWLIPGLLANNVEKQRFFPTVASLVVVSTITYFLVRMITWF